MSGFSVRLTHKIMAIGIVGLIGLLAFGAIYQIGNGLQDASRIVAGEGRAISSLNKQISIKMLEARRAEKDFQLRRNESYLKHHSELSAGIHRDIDKLKSMVRSGDFNVILGKVEIAQRGFANYVKNFAGLAQAEVRLGLNEKLGLTGSLRGAVHDIEARLKEIDDPRLTSLMLTMRRHEKDFMLRRDEKYVGQLKKTAANFSKSAGKRRHSTGAEVRHRREAGKISGGFLCLGHRRAGSRELWRRDVEDVSRHRACDCRGREKCRAAVHCG